MRKWLDEATASLKEALELAERGDVPLLNLYTLAPILYSQKFHMNDDGVIREMIKTNEEQVEHDWSVDENSKDQFKFHYVSSYLNCFVVAGKFDEMKYDRIMEFVCSEMDLFTEDYGNG